MIEQFSRTEILLGGEAMEKLCRAVEGAGPYVDIRMTSTNCNLPIGGTQKILCG